MEITLKRQTEAINSDGIPVMLWKFIDENGDLWNTETSIDGTEAEAASIILHSIQNDFSAPLGLS